MQALGCKITVGGDAGGCYWRGSAAGGRPPQDPGAGRAVLVEGGCGVRTPRPGRGWLLGKKPLKGIRSVWLVPFIL